MSSLLAVIPKKFEFKIELKEFSKDKDLVVKHKIVEVILENGYIFKALVISKGKKYVTLGYGERIRFCKKVQRIIANL